MSEENKSTEAATESSQVNESLGLQTSTDSQESTENTHQSEENTHQSEENTHQQQDNVDDKDHQPPPGSPRFNQIYGKMKDFERKNQEYEMTLAQMREHNKSLENKINDVSDTVHKTEFDTKISSLNQKMREALENQDWEQWSKLDQNRLELMTQVASSKQSEKSQENTNEQQVIENQVAQSIFIQNNPWFNSDSQMKGAAIALDQELQMNPVWQNKPLIERYNEVAKQVKDRFGYNGNNTVKNSGTEGISIPQQTQKPINNNLTEDQKKVAINMFSNLKPQDAIKKYSDQLQLIKEAE